MTTILDHIKKSPHRNRLEGYLKTILPTLQGPILDIGSRNRRYDALMPETPTAIDIVEQKEKNVLYGDVMNLSFPEGSFQSVTCLEVLEYVDNPQQAIDEMRRVMKKGGVLVLSVPFLFRAHDDKFRYTASQLKGMLHRFEINSFDSVGGGFVVILTVLWNKIKKIGFAPFRYGGLLLLLPALLCIRKTTIKSEEYASGYIVVAKKRV